jgi:hypothetical protein
VIYSSSLPTLRCSSHAPQPKQQARGFHSRYFSHPGGRAGSVPGCYDQ